MGKDPNKSEKPLRGSLHGQWAWSPHGKVGSSIWQLDTAALSKASSIRRPLLQFPEPLAEHLKKWSLHSGSQWTSVTF